MNSLTKLHVIMMCMEKFEFWKILLVLIVHTFVCVHTYVYICCNKYYIHVHICVVYCPYVEVLTMLFSYVVDKYHIFLK